MNEEKSIKILILCTGNSCRSQVEDPSHVQGTEEHIMNEFRKTRDLIKEEFYKFYTTNLKIFK